MTQVAGPIRVAQVLGIMNGGGIEQVVMNYYRHVDRLRVQFDFLVGGGSGMVFREEIESLGGRVFMTPARSNPLSYSAALERLFREEGWAIVHAHMNTLSVFALRAAERAGVPVRIAHSHSTSDGAEPVKNAMRVALRTQANRYPTHRLACGRYAGEWLFGKDADFDILHNAIELGRYSFDARTRAQVRAELGLDDATFAVGHVGRFMRQKNHRFLIDAFAGLAALRPDSVLLLVGDGEQRPSAEERARRRGIADKARFLGHRPDADRLYQAFDAFALPSLYEGLCLVGIEAQRAGLPCLFSDAITREIDVTGGCAFLPVGDAGAWAAALARVAEAPARDRSLPGMDGRFEPYDIERAAPRLVAYYERLAASAPRGECA